MSQIQILLRKLAGKLNEAGKIENLWNVGLAIFAWKYI